jgi:hypothetical protein
VKNQIPGRHVSGYGLGWGLYDYAGRMLVSHSGGYDGMYSRVLLVPEEKIGIVILTNSMKGISLPLCYYIIDRFFNLPERDWSSTNLARAKLNLAKKQNRISERQNMRLSGTKPSHNLEEYVGIYRCDMYGNIRILKDAENLHIDFIPAPGLSATLRHWHLNTFEILWHEEQAWFDFGTVQFILDNNGKPNKLLFDVPNDDIFFEEIDAYLIH